MPCTSSKSPKYLVAQEIFAEWYLVSSLWRLSPLSCFQTWFSNSQAQINQFWSSAENLEGEPTLFLTFLYFSIVTPSHCWGLLSMYLLGDRHGYAGQGWTINHVSLYPEGCSGLHYMAAHAIALISKLPVSHPREEGPTRQTLFNLHSSDCLHSTHAGHSSPGGCNPPSPGLTNDSKNRKSKGNSRARMAGIDRDQARHKASLAQNSQQDRACYY